MGCKGKNCFGDIRIPKSFGTGKNKKFGINGNNTPSLEETISLTDWLTENGYCTNCDGNEGSDISFNGNPNEVVYLSDLGEPTTDEDFIRNFLTGEFSVSGALTGDNSIISSIGLGTIEAVFTGAYVDYNDTAIGGLRAFWFSGDLSPFGFLTTGTYAGTISQSGDEGTIMSGAVSGTDYFVALTALNGNNEAIVRAGANSAKLEFFDVTSTALTSVRAEIGLAELNYIDGDELASVEVMAGSSNLLYTTDGIDNFGVVVSAEGVKIETNGVGNRFAALSDYVDLTAGVATRIASISVPNNTVCGGLIIVSGEANDGTNFQCETNIITYSIVNKAGALTITTTNNFGGTPAEASSAGVTTQVVTITDAGSGIASINVQATSTLVETTLRASCQIFKNFGIGAILPA